MGNYSQDPQTALQGALAKGYNRVRFQQGKPILDRELNLAADLAGPERLAQTYLGNGTPDGSNGFAIRGLSPAANDFTISAGLALVNGQQVTLAADSTYQTQPIKSHVANLPVGVSNVYLHVIETEVSSAEDPDLANPGDVKSETAIRTRLDWEVVVSTAAITTPDNYLLAVIDTTAVSVQDHRRLQLSASALRDEVTAARGTAADLATRLNASLGPSGSLVANSVATAQLADASVQASKLAAGAVTEPAFATGAVSNRAMANGGVSIAKLAQTLVFNGQVSVPAAAAAGQLGTQTLTLLKTENPAFLLVSVHYDSPRPPVLGTVSLTWKMQSVVSKILLGGAVHSYNVLIENPATQAISVTCKAYSLAET
jgi:hypothetical protein